MKMIIKIYFVFLLMSFSVMAFPMQDELDDIGSFINQTLETWEVPGLAISVIQDGKVVFSKGFGFRNLETKNPVTTKTLFSVASSTKMFTAAAAAMLVEEGKLEWDEPLRTYFPKFRLYDPSASEKVTMLDLLCHRSGVGRQEFFRINEPDTRKEVMERIRYFEPASDFRSRWQYCNMAYTVAGYMAAQKAETDWESLIRERIFKPLKMNSSLFSVSDAQKVKDHAIPYIVWEEREEMDFYNADLLGPAGAIISNIEDLSKWILFLLNKGKVDEQQLISERSLAMMQSPHMPVPGPIRYPEKFYESYGIGCFISSYRGNLHIYHEGVLYGFTSLISFLPNENIGVVILCNLNGTPLTKILEGYVYDRLLGLEPVDWNQRYVDYYERVKAYYKKMQELGDPDRKQGTTPSHTLEEYNGTFHNEGYGTITIEKRGEDLKAVLTTITCPLNHYHYDVFEMVHPVKHKGWKFTFYTGPMGNIGSFGVEPGDGLKDIIFLRVEH